MSEKTNHPFKQGNRVIVLGTPKARELMDDMCVPEHFVDRAVGKTFTVEDTNTNSAGYHSVCLDDWWVPVKSVAAVDALPEPVAGLGIFPPRDRCRISPIVTITERTSGIKCPQCGHAVSATTYAQAYEQWVQHCS